MDQIAAMRRAAGVEEVVKAGLEQIGCAGITGNVATQLTIRLVGTHHHDQSVPAHQRRDALFHRQIARKRRLRRRGNGVDVGRVQVRLPLDALGAGQTHQFVEHETGTLLALLRSQRRKSIAPFGGFGRVRVLDMLLISRNAVGHEGHFRLEN